MTTREVISALQSLPTEALDCEVIVDLYHNTKAGEPILLIDRKAVYVGPDFGGAKEIEA